MEGALLRRSPSLHLGPDFEIVPEPVWRALYHWYGANLSLPRPVCTGYFPISHYSLNLVFSNYLFNAYIRFILSFRPSSP